MSRWRPRSSSWQTSAANTQLTYPLSEVAPFRCPPPDRPMLGRGWVCAATQLWQNGPGAESSPLRRAKMSRAAPALPRHPCYDQPRMYDVDRHERHCLGWCWNLAFRFGLLACPFGWKGEPDCVCGDGACLDDLGGGGASRCWADRCWVPGLSRICALRARLKDANDPPRLEACTCSIPVPSV